MMMSDDRADATPKSPFIFFGRRFFLDFFLDGIVPQLRCMCAGACVHCTTHINGYKRDSTGVPLPPLYYYRFLLFSSGFNQDPADRLMSDAYYIGGDITR